MRGDENGKLHLMFWSIVMEIWKMVLVKGRNMSTLVNMAALAEF